MIKTVGLAGFKSFGAKTDVAVAPLTVIAGNNSSGKSSLLQAVLLLSQSAGSRPTQDPIELNGFLVNLGTFAELSHRGSKQEVTLSCLVGPVEPLVTSSGRGPVSLTAQTVPLKGAEIEVSFGAVPGRWAGETAVHVKSLRLTAHAEQRERWTLSATSRRGPRPRNAFSSDAVAGDPVLGTDRYRIGLEGTWAGEMVESHLRPDEPADRPVAGLELRGVVPSRVIYPFDRRARRLGALLRRSLLAGGPPPADAKELNRDPELRDQFRSFWASKGVTAVTAKAVVSLADALAASIAVRPSQRSAIRGLIADHVGRYRRREGVTLAYERVSLPVHLEEAAVALTSTLNQVRHLGPLRDAPRPFHSISTSGDPYSVGRSGEYTAAVLHRYGKRNVVHRIGVDEFDEPLSAAVNRWLREMGVHSGARTIEYGKIGHLLTIDDESVPYYMDLTQVGVGVSQLLPVLVQVLVAPAGSTIVVEQPELHLHPSVQSKLAEVLVYAARGGRQVICETHSEYLVSRLRLMVASREIAYGDDLRVHFIERLDGSSRVREVMFGTHGEVVAWPEGFFDQSVTDAANLIRSAVGTK